MSQPVQPVEHTRNPKKQFADDGGITIQSRVKEMGERKGVIAVISPKGGVGKSTLALCLGDYYARMSEEPVALVDCDPDFGSLAAFAPRSGEQQKDLADAICSSEPVDNFAVPLASGCDLYTAPTSGNTLHSLAKTPEQFIRLLDRLKPMYSRIILDLGAGVLNHVASVLMRHCNTAVMVSEPSLVTTAKVLHALDYLKRSHAFIPRDGKYTTRQIVVTINRTNGSEDPRLPIILDEFYRNDILPVEVPEDPDIRCMMDYGNYEYQRSGKAFMAAIEELAGSKNPT